MQSQSTIHPVDGKSITGATVAMISGVFAEINSSKVLVWVSIVVGLSTILYNGIKIYKELKAKQSD